MRKKGFGILELENLGLWILNRSRDLLFSEKEILKTRGVGRCFGGLIWTRKRVKVERVECLGIRIKVDVIFVLTRDLELRWRFLYFIFFND